jgi:GxxExxY protein
VQLKPIHKAQGLSYLKAIARQAGLIFNFGGAIPEFDRLLFDPATRDQPMRTPQTVSPISPDWLYPELAYAVVAGLFEVHTVLGPGFIHRIYANACYHEMTLRGFATRRIKRMQIAYKDKILGDMALGHLLVEGRLMVFPLATQDTPLFYIDGLKSWMRMNGIQLGILANFSTTHLQPLFIRA